MNQRTNVLEATSDTLTAEGRRAAYLLIFSSYFGFAALLQVFPPLLDSVQSEFAVNHQLAALVMTVLMGSIVVLAIPAGISVDRFGVAPVCRWAFGLMILGALVTLLAPTFVLLLVGRAVSGAGGALLINSLLKVIAQTFPRREIGLALGIFAAGLPAGTGVAFNLLNPVGQALGWRWAVACAGILVALMALVFWRLAPKVGLKRQTDMSTNPALALGNGELWRLAATTVFGYMAILAFTTWMPTRLVSYAGIAHWVSVFIASLLLLIDIPFAPLWGRVSDRAGRRKPFIVMAFAVYLFGSLLLPWAARVPGANLVLMLVIVTIMGIGCAMFFPTALTIPAEVMPPHLAGAAYGLFLTSQVFGMLAGPQLLGFVFDQGSTFAGLLVISGLTALGLVSSLTLRSR